jgi:hypothetical protein
MVRRSQNRPSRKPSCGEGQPRVRYQEKRCREWRCGVCEQQYPESQSYCLACYQSLYYFSYINNQLFVAKDDSYLQTYFHLDAATPNDQEDSSDHSDDEVNLGWVESLIM